MVLQIVNNLKKLTMALLVTSAFAAGNAQAGDPGSGKIEFKGQINDGACVIDTEHTAGPITLNSVPASLLKDGEPDGADAKSFSIYLKNCDSSQKHLVSVTFTDKDGYDVSQKYFAPKPGGAQNVYLAITDSAVGVPVLPSDPGIPHALPTEGGDLTLDYKAAYVAVGHKAIAGDFDAFVNYQLSYQ